MKLEHLKTSKQVLEEHLKDPSFRQRWERTALARAVAIRLIAYRADHGLTQSALARKLGMKQPAVARLEVGEKNPSLDTLARISEALGMEFLVDIAPRGRKPLVDKLGDQAEVIERVAKGDTEFVVAVG